MKRISLALALLFFGILDSLGQSISKPNVLAIYTATNDQAHISFVSEAMEWFDQAGEKEGFDFSATSDWSALSPQILQNVQLLLFLDTRPEDPAHRRTFHEYMENGGAWMGFHFSAFALTPSDFPQDWDWYHDRFLGSGQYASNTWRPTSAVLKIEQKDHPVTKGLSQTFKSSPNEWYRWEHDLRQNSDIQIVASIDPLSFPLGTGPKAHEIWHEGYYPVVWTNKSYRMIYFNMGHNDMDYEGGTNKTLSHTFGNEEQDKLILNALHWLLER